MTGERAIAMGVLMTEAISEQRYIDGARIIFSRE